ncbi:MAG: branched-chain amino acid ABC transporter permease, partial [Alphaproteobacteria bacterium]
MFYRESGQFKSSYAEDQAIFPIPQDRWGMVVILLIAFIGVPLIMDDYWANAVFIPFLAYALAALGLNILTGYCGQLSLGTGGFLAVGAYSSYKLMTAFPGLDMIAVLLGAGATTAVVGLLFGLPSLRIKGFYLAVATLAAQFFLIWLFYKVPWFYNYNATGQINVPPREVLGFLVTTQNADDVVKYLFVLTVV